MIEIKNPTLLDSIMKEKMKEESEKILAQIELVSEEEAQAENMKQLEQIVQSLNMDNEDMVLHAMNELSAMISSGENLCFMSNYIFNLIKLIEHYANSENSTISTRATRLLMDFFQISPVLSFGEQGMLFLEYFAQILLNPQQTHIVLCAFCKLIDKSVSFKKMIFDSECLDFFINIDISTVPDSDIAVYAGIFASCIRNDFIDPIPDETSVALLNQIIKILPLGYVNALPECARGCYEFVKSEDHRDFLVQNDIHNILMQQFDFMDDEGKQFSYSTFGYCFLSPSCSEKVLQDIPFSIFEYGIDSQNTDLRLNTVIALSNSFLSDAPYVDQFYESGLYPKILIMLENDNFNIIKEILVGLSHLFGKLTQYSSRMEAFLDESLLRLFTDLIEVDDNDVNNSITESITYMQMICGENELVNELTELIEDTMTVNENVH